MLYFSSHSCNSSWCAQSSHIYSIGLQGTNNICSSSLSQHQVLHWCSLLVLAASSRWWSLHRSRQLDELRWIGAYRLVFGEGCGVLGCFDFAVVFLIVQRAVSVFHLPLYQRCLVWLTLMVPCSGACPCPGSERRSASSVVSIGMVVVLASAICKIATRQQPLNLLSKRVFYLHTINGLLLDLMQHIYKIRWYSVCHFSLRNRWSYYIFTVNLRCLSSIMPSGVATLISPHGLSRQMFSWLVFVLDLFLLTRYKSSSCLVYVTMQHKLDPLEQMGNLTRVWFCLDFVLELCKLLKRMPVRQGDMLS